MSSAGAAPRTIVFVASSDNTRDVFDRVFPSVLKYWPDCPYPVYAGFNSDPEPGSRSGARGFAPVLADRAGWQGELLAQLAQTPGEAVLLLLDDFLFLRRVETTKVETLESLFHAQGLSYLRLTPVRRAALSRLAHAFLPGAALIEPVPAGDPYYSSLQAALWRKSHLLEALRAQPDIWAFERRVTADPHSAVRRGSPLHYRHVVEKGRWLPNARMLMRRAGLPADLGRRARWSRAYGTRRLLGMLRFEVFGYLPMRLRRLWSGRHG